MAEQLEVIEIIEVPDEPDPALIEAKAARLCAQKIEPRIIESWIADFSHLLPRGHARMVIRTSSLSRGRGQRY